MAMRGDLILGYLCAGLAFLLWLGMLAGEAYDAGTGIGASSLTYVAIDESGSLRVSGFTNGQDAFRGLSIGDEIVRIDGDEVLPRDQMGFRNAIAHAHGRLTVRSAEGERSLDLNLQGVTFPLLDLVKDLFLGAMGLVALIFGPRNWLTCLTAICAFLAGHTGGTAPIGPSPAASAALATGFSLSIACALCTGVNLAQWIIGERRPLRFAVPWLLFPVFFSVLSLFFGGPVPPPIALVHLFATDLVVLVSMFVLLLSGVRRAVGRQRHQINWIVGAVGLAFLLIAGSWILFSISDPEDGRRASVAMNEWYLLVIPLGVLMASLKADFAGIDRAAARTVTYAGLIVTLALAFEFAFEPMAGLLAVRFGLAESAGQSLLIVGAALAGPKVRDWLQPKVDAWLAPVDVDD